MDADRLNSPSTSAISLDVFGHQLLFSQDPNSKHLGTTVWDSSMVFVKFLEKNCRRGRFCSSRLKGKRAIELGAGCGVAGLGMALLGCDVVATDQMEVLPLLKRNVEHNTSRISQMNHDSDSFGSIQVAELDWENEDHIRAVGAPFDYVLGTDVVYAEHLLEPLLQTMLALSGPKTTILLGYEVRSTSVHEQMLQTWKKYFDVKIVPKAKMDSKYQHPSIQLFIMGLKSIVGTSRIINSIDQCINQQDDDSGTANETLENGATEETSNGAETSGSGVTKQDCPPVIGIPKKNLSDWEARRYGAMAARLLRDVKIT